MLKRWTRSGGDLQPLQQPAGAPSAAAGGANGRVLFGRDRGGDGESRWEDENLVPREPR